MSSSSLSSNARFLGLSSGGGEDAGRPGVDIVGGSGGKCKILILFNYAGFHRRADQATINGVDEWMDGGCSSGIDVGFGEQGEEGEEVIGLTITGNPRGA